MPQDQTLKLHAKGDNVKRTTTPANGNSRTLH